MLSDTDALPQKKEQKVSFSATISPLQEIWGGKDSHCPIVQTENA